MVHQKITAKQEAVYDYIKSYIELNSFPPSVRDVAEALGVSSPATIHGHISTLVEKGYLSRNAGKSRALSLLADPQDRESILKDNEGPSDPGLSYGEVVGVPVVGSVAAGSPILAEENIEDTYALPASLIHGETYMLRVKGESMINIGIFDGDLVIVRKQDTANNGDVVVALLEDSATVKTYYREANRIRLQPENDTMEPIYSTDVRIAGKVVGLLRMGL
ncbi:MAG: transcriptional repressor LexA [Coriobacteriia bacterium]|nr:transcriptional repressor LexA [Coriobacteriia bacterium]